MKKVILFLGVFILLMTVASSTATVSNYSIDKSYIGGSNIIGWVDLTLDKELISSTVKDSEGTELTLIDFLGKANHDYSCSPSDCSEAYSPDIGVSGVPISFSSGDEKIFGLEYWGLIEEVKEISFNITSDSIGSSTNQLKIDILNDGEYEAGNTVSSEIFSDIKMGCFTEEGIPSPIETGIEDLEPYCQRISIEESPSLKIGAWIKKVEGAVTNVTMTLNSMEGVKLQECNIGASDISSSGDFASCDIDILIPSKEDYYVCVIAKDSADEYKTKASRLPGKTNRCGFLGFSPKDEDGSYQIGVREMGFGAVGTIKISNELSGGGTISGVATEYIGNEYGSFDCADSPCYVPIRIKSSVDQTITIDNIVSKYKTVTTSDLTERDMNLMTNKLATISFEKTKIILNDIFKVKNEKGSREYILTIGETEAINETIMVEEGSFSIYPNLVVSGKATEFTVSSGRDNETVLYNWSFGDSSEIESTVSPKVTHTYTDIGEYSLFVSFIDANDKVLSKSFKINVASAKDLVVSEIARMKSELNSMESKIKLSLTEYEKNKLYEKVNVSEIVKKIIEIESNISDDSTPEEYGIILEEISNIAVPEKLLRSDFSIVPFFPNRNEIDIEVLKDITKETRDQGSYTQVENAILLWSKNDISVSMQQSDMSLEWRDRNEFILKSFKLKLTPKSRVSEYYLIFDNSILSTDDQSVIEGINGKSYIKIPGDSRSVNIFSSSDILFSDLPIVISPAISDLTISIGGDFPEADEEVNKVGRFFLWLMLILFVGFIVYLILKHWYRVKYEKYLFKDRNNLYNVILYVNKNMSAGVPIEDIRESLKKSGWSSEQIRYILRKYEGRETGMPGLGFGSKKKIMIPIPKKSNKNMFQDRKYKP